MRTPVIVVPDLPLSNRTCLIKSYLLWEKAELVVEIKMRVISKETRFFTYSLIHLTSKLYIALHLSVQVETDQSTNGLNTQTQSDVIQIQQDSRARILLK